MSALERLKQYVARIFFSGEEMMLSILLIDEWGMEKERKKLKPQLFFGKK